MDSTPTDPAPASSGSRTVVFEETGEEREVVGYCQVCDVDPAAWPPVIVSPRGIVHASDGYDSTDCGKNATGDKWWWLA